MNLDLAPVTRAFDPIWRQIKLLFSEYEFLTIVCALLVVMMTVSFYRFLRSISPALVGLFLLIVLMMLVLHWTHTRTEPALFTPFVQWLAQFFPTAPSA